MKRYHCRFRSGSVLLLVLIAGGFLLVGCSSVEERQTNALRLLGGVSGSASGALQQAMMQVRGAVELGKGVVGTVQEGAADIRHRADTVSEGVQKVQEGKKLIEEGLGTGEEEANQ